MESGPVSVRSLLTDGKASGIEGWPPHPSTAWT